MLAYVCFHHFSRTHSTLMLNRCWRIFLMAIFFIRVFAWEYEIAMWSPKLVGIHSIHTVFTLQAQIHLFIFRGLDFNKLVGLKISISKNFFCWFFMLSNNLHKVLTIFTIYGFKVFARALRYFISFHLLNWQTS